MEKAIQALKIRNSAFGDFDISPNLFVILELWKIVNVDGKVKYEVRTQRIQEQKTFTYPCYLDAYHYFEYCRKRFSLSIARCS